MPELDLLLRGGTLVTANEARVAGIVIATIFKDGQITSKPLGELARP